MFRRLFSSAPPLSIFFATDIHGSEKCFKKFLNAGKFYGVDVLILGADLTGKLIVPVSREGSRWNVDYLGHKRSLQTEAEVGEFEAMVRDNGHYPFRASEEEISYYEEDAGRQEELFIRVLCDSVRRWMELADERLKGTGVRCFVAPGNDDPHEIGPIIDEAEYVQNFDERCVELDDAHRMVGIGWSNPTPWDTPRELSEEELGRRMSALFEAVEDRDHLVAALHVPPYDSGLDQAPQLSEDLQVQASVGQVVMRPVGSTAVREVLEKYQPMLGLHGHVHESQGQTRIGRTLCLNPGSEYHEAVLKGALVTISGDKVKHFQFVNG